MKQAIYLSPHSDDVCFSLGGHLTSHPEGYLVTVFSRSLFAPGVAGLPASPAARAAAVSSIRTAEDDAFALTCALRRLPLGFDEPGVRRRRPFGDLRSDDVQRIRAPLLDLLWTLRSRWETRPTLFVPLGIGAHVDHRAVFLCVLAELVGLREAFDLAFYEDLPYASRPAARAHALLEFHSALRALAPEREVHELGGNVSRKLALIGLYRSQLTTATVDIDDFTPAAPECRRPHEAWWRV